MRKLILVIIMSLFLVGCGSSNPIAPVVASDETTPNIKIYDSTPWRISQDASGTIRIY